MDPLLTATEPVTITEPEVNTTEPEPLTEEATKTEPTTLDNVTTNKPNIETTTSANVLDDKVTVSREVNMISIVLSAISSAVFVVALILSGLALLSFRSKQNKKKEKTWKLSKPLHAEIPTFSPHSSLEVKKNLRLGNYKVSYELCRKKFEDWFKVTDLTSLTNVEEKCTHNIKTDQSHSLHSPVTPQNVKSNSVVQSGALHNSNRNAKTDPISLKSDLTRLLSTNKWQKFHKNN